MRPSTPAGNENAHVGNSPTNGHVHELLLERFQKPARIKLHGMPPFVAGWRVVCPTDAATACRVSVSLTEMGSSSSSPSFDPALQSFVLEAGQSMDMPLANISVGTHTKFEFAVKPVEGQLAAYTVTAYVVCDDDMAKPPVLPTKHTSKPKGPPPAAADPESASLMELINCSLVVGGQGAAAQLVHIQQQAVVMRKALQVVAEALDCTVAVDKALREGRLRPLDLDVAKDVALRLQLWELVCAYDVPWVRLGLSTLTGVPCERALPADLRFLFEARVLECPDIIRDHQYTKLGAFENNVPFAVAMQRHALRHCLALFWFMDRAKARALLESRLFVKENPLKSSEAVVKQFGEVLFGESNLPAQLDKLGYRVTAQQSALDEYSLAVTDLEHDLRNGVVLGALTKALANVDVMAKLRVPAGGEPNLPRVHCLGNVKKALDGLRAAGLELDSGRRGKVTAQDIVDGHRDKTHALVWMIVARFSLARLLDEDALRTEVRRVGLRLRNSDTWKHTVARLPPASQTPESPDERLAALVLSWMQAVCAGFGVLVTDMASALADGRVPCLLVHFYNPQLLPMAAIPAGQAPSNNFAVLRAACDALGKVPLRLRAASKPPSPRFAVAFCVTLCARLLSASQEVRAAQTIQTLWALHRARTGDGDAAKAAALARRQRRRRAWDYVSLVVEPPRPRPAEPASRPVARSGVVGSSGGTASGAVAGALLEARRKAQRDEDAARETARLEKEAALAVRAAERRQAETRERERADKLRVLAERDAHERAARMERERVQQAAVEAAEAARRDERAARVEHEAAATSQALEERERQRAAAVQREREERAAAEARRAAAEARAAAEEDARQERDEAAARLAAREREARETAAREQARRSEREAAAAQAAMQAAAGEARAAATAAAVRARDEEEKARAKELAVERRERELERRAEQLARDEADAAAKRAKAADAAQRAAEAAASFERDEARKRREERHEQGRAAAHDELQRADALAVERRVCAVLAQPMAGRALLELVQADAQARAALAGHLDELARLVRRCTRGDGGVLVALLKAGLLALPERHSGGALCGAALDVMQTF